MVLFGGGMFNTITVADTGTGMSFNDLDRNFLVIGTASRKKEVEACDYEPAARRLNSRRAPSRSAGTRQIITPATATQQASTMSNSALPSPPSGLKPNSFSIQSMSFSPRYAICFTLAALHLRGKRFDSVFFAKASAASRWVERKRHVACGVIQHQCIAARQRRPGIHRC
jgi:hypothetical protein